LSGLDGIQWEVLPDGMDYFAGPLNEGMCRYSELKDGTLDLADVAVMNDMLMVRRENQRIYERHLKDMQDG